MSDAPLAQPWFGLGQVALPFSVGDLMSHAVNLIRFLRTHPIGGKHPWRSLARALRWQLRSRFSPAIEVGWIDGSVLVASRGMTAATGNIYCGLYECADMALLLHLLRTDDLFVDVGANIGSYTILAAKVCGCPSMSVEPGGPALAALRRNISANGISGVVSVQPVAVGAADTEVLFSSDLGTMNHVLDTETSSHKSPGAVRVPMRTLDSLLPSSGRWPTLIKVDVEGFEQQVLEGAARTLGNSSLLALLLETVTTKSAAMLNSHGFEEASYDPFSRVLGSPGQYRMNNRLFVRNPDQIDARVKRAPIRTIHGVLI